MERKCFPQKKKKMVDSEKRKKKEEGKNINVGEVQNGGFYRQQMGARRETRRRALEGRRRRETQGAIGILDFLSCVNALPLI